MRRFGVLVCVTAATLALASAAVAAGSGSDYVLTARTDHGSGYAPTFTGNGFLGVRVPASGQGYAGGSVPAQSELAGFYAKPTNPKTVSDSVQQRANIPTWSTLLFGDGTQTFAPNVGTTTGWQQSIDLHTGIITTTATWRASDGHTAKVTYQVLTDRANEHIGLVQLTVIPQWTGTATVTDQIDGSPATLTNQVTKGFDAAQHQDYVEVVTQGTGIHAAIASRLTTSPNITATPVEVGAGADQSIGQQVTFPVTAGQSYTITKYVGVDDSQSAANPVSAAQAEAAAAASTGAAALMSANNAAWATLWGGRIDVVGDRTLATDVNASEFYLWSNTRDGVDWSVSPAGLSSNGYDGHIFWDAETWMYPSLLAQHSSLAAGMNSYRFNRLSPAEQHATATGYKGARFPWESALDGTEQIPPPVSINSEGLYEQHITSDIALAQWQYYLVTGDRSWLARRGYPVLSGAAAFWASRVTPAAHGTYHINNVTGPDEENPNVNNEVYTTVAARTTLQDAVAAAQALGTPAPAAWSQIARGLVISTSRVDGTQIHKEFSGYRAQMVKQADVTLLQYPWLYPMPASVARNDINFYVPRNDPGGPSMSDAVNSIDSSTLGTPGCSSFVFTQRSYEPFIRDVFDQFSETRTGGAFTFMTGIGGFLQEFLYGYSGLRWEPNGVRIAPSLTSQLAGVVLRNLSWRGRVFQVSVGRRTTTVTLLSGPALPVMTPAGQRQVTEGHALRVPTARPDLAQTPDVVRCQRAAATSSAPGAPPLAAVDGSPATDWQPVRLPATVTVPTRAGHRVIGRVTLDWGRLWPLVTKPNVPPAPGPVKTLRASSYTLQASTDGRHWRTVATVKGVNRRTTDVLSFPRVRARWLRIRITKGSQKPLKKTKTNQHPPSTMPMLEELAATR
ncbi:MAG TPA: discoidin domain-containing protein [Solirubrobacteraceae bacterium]|nr:discoidin domain-containing protein [Solirubrobacteraceae bacterium]